jgi:hypothetical protein
MHVVFILNGFHVWMLTMEKCVMGFWVGRTHAARCPFLNDIQGTDRLLNKCTFDISIIYGPNN